MIVGMRRSLYQIIKLHLILMLDIRVILISILFIVFSLSVANENLFPIEFFGKYKWIILIIAFIYAVVYWRQSILYYSHLHRVLELLLGIFVFELTLTTILQANDLVNATLRSLSFALLYVVAIVSPIFGQRDNDGLRLITSILLVSGGYVIGSLYFLISEFSFVGGRLAGITNNANTLGTIAMISSVCCFGLLVFNQHLMLDFYTKTSLLILLFSSFFEIFLTGSRSSIIGLSIAIIFILLVSNRKKYTILVLAIVGISYFFLSKISNILSFELEGLYSEREWTGEGRGYIWTEQFQRWETSPVFGWGMEINPDSNTARRGGESSFLDLLSATGILGFFPFILSFVVCLWTGYKKAIFWLRSAQKCAKYTHSPEFVSLVVSMGLIVGIAINSIGEGYLSAVGSMPSLIYWFSLGYCALVKIK